MLKDTLTLKSEHCPTISPGISVTVQNIFIFPTTRSVFVTIKDMENKAFNAKGHPEDIISTIRFEWDTFESGKGTTLLKDIIAFKLIFTDIKRNPSLYKTVAMGSPFNCVLGKYMGEFEQGLEELFGLSTFIGSEQATDPREKLLLNLFGLGPHWDTRDPALPIQVWVEEAERVLELLKGL